MKPTEPFQKALYAEMLGRIKEDDATVPYRRGGYYYYSRTEKGKQYPILCRPHGGLDAPQEVTPDPNPPPHGPALLSLGAHALSDDRPRPLYTPGFTRTRADTLD